MTWLPWKLRKQLQTAYRGNDVLMRAVAHAHRELDRLDGHEERIRLAPADRIALYGLEQRLQQKADETGKTMNWPCNRCRPLWADDTFNADTFHTHTVDPHMPVTS